MSKNVVITGANRGIGLAMAKICQQRGDTVYALCRQSSSELSSLDVHVIEQIEIATEAGIARAQSALSGINIDLLINNAGILRDESLTDFNKETIVEQFNVNAVAPIALTQALLDNLSSNSKVALITSRMGSITDNTSGGRYGYRMSKALSPKQIAVGIYHPGYVKTDMVNVQGQTSNGDITSTEAAMRLLTLMADLTMSESGVFKHSNGEILPW